MKDILYYIVTVLALILVIGFVYKKPKVLNYDAEKGLATKTTVKVNTTLIDLGSIPLNSSISGKYVFHNLGKKGFEIESITTNCSCTQSEFSKNIIKPNDSTTIVLKYDSTRLGMFQSTGIVVSRSFAKPILLVLQGNVVSCVK